MSASPSPQPPAAPPGPPAVGSWSPWGAIDGVQVLADGVVFVSTPSHGGAWVAPAAQARIPERIEPMHGRSWFEEDCEIWAPILVFDGDDAANTRSMAVAILARWKPDWLDALAPVCGVPNAAQVARILDRHAELAPIVEPDFATWRRCAGSGAVEGWVGGVWLTIAPDGEAVG